MDLGTIIGIVVAFGAILVSMILEGGSPGALFLLPALLLVFGGTIGVTMAGGMLKDSLGLIGWVKVALLAKAPTDDDTVATIVRLAETARREGLLALEEAAKDVTDPFLKRGLELAVDGTDSEEIRDILEAAIEAKRARDKVGAKMFTDMGGFAPTLGVAGTVIGLVHVLENLSKPDKLGGLIAGAFVATLWGVLSANALWLPMGNKVARLSQLEITRMEVMLEGVISIQSGTNPRVLQQKLESYLPPSAAVKAQSKKAA